tara:strand:+ start:695 stop:1060 length:366 start_codon:yes stop_codon:yes gene_type:complete
MKKTILTIALIITISFVYSQNRYIKKLELAKKTFLFYQDSPFERVFKKIGRYKRNTIFVEKRCDGVFLIIQSKTIKQNSYYYISKTYTELEFNELEDINNFILKLRYGKSKNKIHKRISDS